MPHRDLTVSLRFARHSIVRTHGNLRHFRTAIQSSELTKIFVNFPSLVTLASPIVAGSTLFAVFLTRSSARPRRLPIGNENKINHNFTPSTTRESPSRLCLLFLPSLSLSFSLSLDGAATCSREENLPRSEPITTNLLVVADFLPPYGKGRQFFFPLDGAVKCDNTYCKPRGRGWGI